MQVLPVAAGLLLLYKAGRVKYIKQKYHLYSVVHEYTRFPLNPEHSIHLFQYIFIACQQE